MYKEDIKRVHTYHLFVFKYPRTVPRQHPAGYRPHFGCGVREVLGSEVGGGEGGVVGDSEG